MIKGLTYEEDVISPELQNKLIGFAEKVVIPTTSGKAPRYAKNYGLSSFVFERVKRFIRHYNEEPIP